jgi:benzoyl-CoA reductase subunit C
MKSGLESVVFEKFVAIAGSIMNPSVQKWKDGGGKVMGYTCSFVPEELIIAAGMLPFRIRATGSVSAGRADDYFESANYLLRQMTLKVESAVTVYGPRNMEISAI